jgi:Protein of unknown function (DUF1266)
MGFFSKLLGAFKSVRINENEPLLGLELKRVLVSSMYAEQQSAFLNSYATGMNEGDRKNILTQWWDINSKQDALTTIQYLLQEGYSELFPIIADAFEDKKGNYAQILEERAPAEKLDKAIMLFRNLRNANDELIKEKIITTPGDIKKIGISGWDFGRCAFIARLCYEEGHINLQECKHYLEASLQALKKQCSSWEQYTKSYIIGRAMWSSDSNSGMAVIARNLLTNPKSPLLTNPL